MFVVIPFAFVIGLVFEAIVGHHVIDKDYAEKIIRVHHPFFSVTIFSAVMTGVWLWAASLVAGGAENYFVLRELPGAIATNRLLRRVFGATRASRLSRFLTEQASGFGGNVGFGVLLGFMPMLFVLVGLPLEVRHVTFVTGQLAYAALQLGPSVLARSDFLWALLSIPMVGLINFSVSFTFAIVVALRARGLGVRSQVSLARAVLPDQGNLAGLEQDTQIAAYLLEPGLTGGYPLPDVVRRYREELVASGVPQEQARCVTDRFFAALADAQLRQFQARKALTDDERQRLRTLGEECARVGTGT